MRFELHVFHHFPQDQTAPAWVNKILQRVELTESRVMAKVEEKVAEAMAVLESMGTSIVGVKGDIEAQTAEIASLKDQLAQAGNLTPEQEAAFDALIQKGKEQAAALSDLDAQNPATGGGAGTNSPGGEVVEQPNPDA